MGLHASKVVSLAALQLNENPCVLVAGNAKTAADEMKWKINDWRKQATTASTKKGLLKKMKM